MVNAMYRILIVEDDESIARSVKTHLESWNYEVCCAEDFSNVAVRSRRLIRSLY